MSEGDNSKQAAADQPPPYAPPPAGFQQQNVSQNYYPPAQYPPTSSQYPPVSSQYGGQYGQQQYTMAGQAYSTQPGPGGRTDVVVVSTQPSNAVVVRTGNCPSCRVGFLVDQFTCCGIFMAIFFFPIGLICCLLMKRQTGFLVDQFTCCGILMAVFFFPIGLICCIMMKRQVCSHCGAIF